MALTRATNRMMNGASVNILEFGATTGMSGDCTAAINDAITYLASNYYESAKAIFFPAGIYRITSTINIDLSTASLTFYSDTKATIYIDVPDGDWGIDVDYSTGGTANFVTFNMTNIALADLANPRYVKNGLRTKRVLGSKFTQCEFNYLNIAVDMGDDSNLNTFDTCMWRGNVNGYKSTAGVASHNQFINCQWRYHSGTAFDSTNSGENIIIGGDFEPGNASPAIIANALTAIRCRYERNGSNGQPGITVLSNNDLDFGCFSDGGTQVLPFYDVQGSNNKLKVKGTGGTAAYMNSGSTNNEVEIYKFETLIAGGAAIYNQGSEERSNIIKTKGSMQNSVAGDMVETNKDNLVSADLTTWTATNCTVTSLGNGGYSIVSTGSGTAKISTTLTGTFTDLHVISTGRASNSSGQAALLIGGTTVGSMAGWPAYWSRKIFSTFYTTTYTNPAIEIQLDNTGGTGSACTIYNFRIAEGRTPD